MSNEATCPEPPPLPEKRKQVSGVWIHALIGAVVVGGIAFAAGFFGAIIFAPESNQGPMIGIFITGPAGFFVGLIGGALVGFWRSMGKADAPAAIEPSPVPWLGMAAMLGVVAVIACGIPFIPPLAIVAVPLAGLSLVIAGRVIFRRTRWTLFRAMSALIALALDGFALYLALGSHHLIDWMEGH